MEEKYRARIGYNGNLKDISLEICKDYNLGNFKSNKIILIGYEDFNFALETSKGKYLVKVFSNFRTLDDCKRYMGIMGAAIKAKIATPKLYESGQGYLYIKNIGKVKLRLCVMDFIEGNTLFELGYKPNASEIKFLANQAVLINSIDLKPTFIFDAWAITNLLSVFEKNKDSLTKKDKLLVEPIVEKFKEFKIDKLPHCLVHGDIIGTNVIKDKDNKLWIIDFAVSNYSPRIQELAILACNLCFDGKDMEKSKQNLEVALKEYQNKIKLTNEELSALPLYIQFAHAMHIICAGFEKEVNHNTSKENEYFLNEGRMGLKQGSL